jgi:hypothetical protein
VKIKNLEYWRYELRREVRENQAAPKAIRLGGSGDFWFMMVSPMASFDRTEVNALIDLAAEQIEAVQAVYAETLAEST